jgi:TRAP-type C4-dicarboxylate transport system permease small subunit
MTDAAPTAGRPADPVGRLLYAVSRWLAVVCGAILASIAAMETVSIIQRAITGAPIRGDFELVQFGTAVIIFGFMPYCQIVKGNVIVDFFLAKASARTKAWCDAAASALYALVAALLTWRMWLGGADLARAGESTTTINVKLWVCFPPIVASLALLAVIAAYTCWRDLRGVAR